MDSEPEKYQSTTQTTNLFNNNKQQEIGHLPFQFGRVPFPRLYHVLVEIWTLSQQLFDGWYGMGDGTKVKAVNEIVAWINDLEDTRYDSGCREKLYDLLSPQRLLIIEKALGRLKTVKNRDRFQNIISQLKQLREKLVLSS